MRFLVDECTGPKVAAWLRENDYDVFSVFDSARGMDNDSEPLIITPSLREQHASHLRNRGSYRPQGQYLARPFP
jgi:hypothetical protein